MLASETEDKAFFKWFEFLKKYLMQISILGGIISQNEKYDFFKNE